MVLLVDDDLELCQLLSQYLGQHGFSVELEHDGRAALKRLEATDPGAFDVIVLDIHMPFFDGLNVLRRIRPQFPAPILMLSAQAEDMDRVLGLDLGADDFMSKPASPRELVARINALLRRAGAPQAVAVDTPPGAVIRIGDLEIVTDARRVFVGAQEVTLTSAEFDVLHWLVRNAGNVVGRDPLSRIALGRPATVFDRSIDTHVSRLRRKLGPNIDGSPRLSTIRNTGYMYVAAHAMRTGVGA